MKFGITRWTGCISALTLSGVLLCGCGGYDAYTPYYTKDAISVQTAALIGTYVPTLESAKKIKDEGQYPPAKTFITLSQDRTFHISNIPDWWENDFGRAKGLFDNGRGKWSIIDSQRGASIKLEFSSSKGLRAERWSQQRTLSGLINLIGEAPPYLLHMPLGDPDNGNAMQFQKVTTATTR